jgi:predicted DNA-binding transcriptional regulator YafY
LKVATSNEARDQVSKYERLARLLKIITLVKANPRLTRSDIARLCEVNSVRTIQRDINSLAIAGIPIYWSGEGYEIMPGFFLPPVTLSVEEALSLAISAKAYSEGEGKFHESTVGSAISKIMATLPRRTRELLETGSDKISVESRKVTDVGGLVSRLYQAVLNAKQLRINYYSYSRNSVSERIIDPYALTFRRRAWYLVAFCHTRNAIRMFRTNRIKAMDYTGRAFLYPSNFSLEEYMAKSWQTMRGNKGEEAEVVVQFGAKIAPLIKEVNWHPTQRIEDLPDGSILFTVTVPETEEIKLWILSYGHEAEVISPESLREVTAAAAEKMCRRYGRILQQ